MTKDHELVVRITYTGLKATQYFSKQSHDGVLQLKRDLSELKIPQPKTQNVIFVSHGCMKAFWIAPLNSHVYRCLQLSVNEPNSKRYTQKDLKRLEITQIHFEKYLYDPIGPGSEAWAAASYPPIQPSSSKEMQPQNNGQQGQGVAPSVCTNAPGSSAIKRPANPGNHDPSLGSNKRVRLDIEAPQRTTGANAILPVYNQPPVAIPSLHFGATAAAQIGKRTWHSGPPPSTLSTQMLTQWNHQPTQVPGTLGQALNVQMQRPSAVIETLDQTAGNSSVPQAQMHLLQSNPWQTRFLSQSPQQNLESQSPRGYWRLKTSDEHGGVAVTQSQTQTQTNRAQMQNRAVPQVQEPQSNPTPQKSHVPSTSGGSTAAAAAAAMDVDPIPVQQNDQIRPSVTLATTSNEMNDGSVQQLQGRLATVRRELEVQLQQELDIYQQIQQIEPAPASPRDKAFLTRVEDLRIQVTELEKVLKETREKVNIVQGTLGVAQRERKKASDELAEEQKSRLEVEERLRDEQARFAQMNEELQKERTLRVEAEAQLQSERKGRAEMDEELRKEKALRVEVEGDLVRERQGRAGIDADLQQERRLRAEVEAQLQKEKPLRQQGRAEIEAEPAVDFEMGELKQEDPWDQLEDERKRRVKLEERLREEQRRRVEAEHLLKDVERECRAPFVVPALLEAFSTISRITSRALEANASQII